ncbi:MAG: squalene synthase HpnC [Planctomycetes bacterium]|nr:squalene synthase HpnC [Planctomycetota bacterium]
MGSAASIDLSPPRLLAESLTACGLDPLAPRVRDYEEAQAYARHLATSHYENFHVGTWLFPKAAREHAYNVYAYCRWSDDLADETGDRERSLALLAWWREELEACFAGEPRHPVFVALRRSIEVCELEAKPFHDLLDAFVQDQRVFRYPTFAELLDYCRRSADPVGRIVLALLGHRDERRRLLSDATCTGLQLANFWQDVENDLRRGRIYLPLEDMARFGVNEEDLAMPEANEAVRELLRFEVERAREFFARGLELVGLVAGRARFDIDLFNRGGIAILDAIAAQGFDVLRRRPRITKGRKIGLLLGALARGLVTRSGR